MLNNVCYIIWNCMDKELTLHDHLIRVKNIQRHQLVLHKWWPRHHYGHDWIIGQNYSITEIFFATLRTDSLIEGDHVIQVTRKIIQIQSVLKRNLTSNKCFDKQGNHLLCFVCYIIWNCINKRDHLIQVTTVEKDPLVLWWRWLLNRSKLFWKYFLGGLIKGDRLNIHVRLYLHNANVNANANGKLHVQVQCHKFPPQPSIFFSNILIL